MLYSCTHVATVGVKGLKVIPRLVSMGSSLSSNLNITVLLQREHLKILTQIDPPSVALGVEDIRWQIAAEWLEISQCSMHYARNWERIGNHHRSFQRYHR